MNLRALAKNWKVRLALLIAVVGPGFITANVDNDAGGIYTYSLAGAQFGYSLLWTMIPITIALVVVQEMASRMGAVTGKGLSDLIREEFGFRITFWLMLALVVTNFGNVVAEFAGVASSLELFGLSRYIVVPAAAVIVWLLVVQGTYSSVEKIFLARVRLLRLLHRRGSARAPGLEGGGVRNRDAGPSGLGIRNYPLPVHADRPGRHHDRAVDAVLPAGVGRREGHHGAAVPRRRGGT